MKQASTDSLTEILSKDTFRSQVSSLLTKNNRLPIEIMGENEAGLLHFYMQQSLFYFLVPDCFFPEDFCASFLTAEALGFRCTGSGALFFCV